jgi:DHA3 family macrolide efflux protein-like MFS transporter
VAGKNSKAMVKWILFPNQTPGMRAFLLFWSGQLFSLLGSAMTRFALTIWAYQITGEATALSLMAFFSFAPQVLMAPLAGAVVDRWNRKWMMALADIATFLSTLALLILFFSGVLQIWHVYLAGAFASVFASFHWPAYSASVTLMVPKKQYARATALSTLAESSSTILAPILGAALIAMVGVGWVFVTHLATLSIGLSVLLLVSIPSPVRSQAGREAAGSLLKESFFGFRYIFAHKGLLGLQSIFLLGNLFFAFSWILAAPMILARTASNAATLAAVESAGGVGGVVGGLLFSITGGLFKRRTDGVFIGWALPALFMGTLVATGQSLPLWMAGFFLSSSMGGLNYISNQAIWQSKVPPDIQGRVFSTRMLIAQGISPISMLVAGPLADRVFEPAMQPGGSLAASLGPLFGTGPGAGMAVLIALTSFLTILSGLSGYLFPEVRDVEKRIPDHDIR